LSEDKSTPGTAVTDGDGNASSTPQAATTIPIAVAARMLRRVTDAFQTL
jgi:hypothetical protein